MSQEFIDGKVKAIFKDSQHPFPLNMAMACAWIMANLKGINLKILDVKELSSLSDYFVLASASNKIQVQAMFQEIITQLKKNGIKDVPTREGHIESPWILVDAKDVIIHIFLESHRDVYDLDHLWREAKQIKIPEEYYFNAHEEVAPKLSKEHYF